MSKICGHCNRRFPTLYSPMLIWCKVDKIFVCRRCWEDVCKEGHGKGDKNRSFHPFFEFIGISILISLGIAFGLFGLMDVYLSWEWNNLEVTNISDLPEEELIKVEGTIFGNPDEIIITGKEESSRSGHEWVFNDNIIFLLNDTTGSIKVSTEKYYKIENGLHPAPDREFTDGRTYNSGDNITIVGKVITKGEERILYISWLGPLNSKMNPSFWSYFLVFLIVLPSCIGYLYILKRAITKFKLHNRKTQYKNPIEIAKNDFIKDPSLYWKKNSKLSRRQFGAIIALIILSGLLLIILFIFNSYGSYLHTYTDYLFSGIFYMIIIPFMIVFPALYFFNIPEIKPDEIAISDKGIHFYYNHYIMRYLKDDFIGWEEIKGIESYSGKTTTWFISKKNDTSENITGLRKDIRESLISIWNNYKLSNKKKLVIYKQLKK